MCKSKISVRKYIKLYLWILFYHIALYIIFVAAGYSDLSVKSMVNVLLPFSSIADGFTSAFMAFYLMIPFLNIAINAMNKKQHLSLIALCVLIYTVTPMLGLKVVFNYITWFSVIYIISAYIRLYPEKWFDIKTLWGIAAAAAVIVSWISVVGIAYIATLYKGEIISRVYYFVADSNKPLALITAICAFMYFRNINIGYHKWINMIAASAFGVLIIHANSDAMRQWLWKDTLNNVVYMNTNMVYIHAVVSVIGIYIICTIIDMLRFNLLEKPFFKWYDRKFTK